MALFSVNQNVQWFTAGDTQIAAFNATTNYTSGDKVMYGGKLYKFTSTHSATAWTGTDVEEIPFTENVGDIFVKANESNANASKVFFTYISDAGAKRSEIIEKGNGGHVTVTPAKTTYGNTVSISLAQDPVIAQNYGIVINIPNYQAIGDNQFNEITTTVVAKTAVKSDLLKELAFYMYANLGDLDAEMMDIILLASGSATKLNKDTELANLSGSYDTIYIAEKESSWIQGTMQRDRVAINTTNVFAMPIISSGIETNAWATIIGIDGDTSNYSNFATSKAYKVGDKVVNSSTYYVCNTAHTSSSSIDTTKFTTVYPANVNHWNNSKDIADMEWFYLGEHGDQQRMVGYPNVVMHNTNEYYKIKTNNTNGYDLIQIHHAYVGSNHAVQKSEKDIIIACSAADSHASAKAILSQFAEFFVEVDVPDFSKSENYTF